MASATQRNTQASETSEQQWFLDRFKMLHATQGADGALSLINIYKEIPISHPASIISIKGHRLELRTSALQLAALGQCKEAYIRLPDDYATVLGKVEQIDPLRKTVLLSNFSYVKPEEERRNTLRVRFKRPISVIMHAGGSKISGVIHDISLGGCCVNTLVGAGLEHHDDLRVDFKLIDQASCQICCMEIACSLIRVEGNFAPFKCAIRFKHTAKSEQFLTVFINQRQREILKELGAAC